ncbi:MAG: redoxin, partial [Bryobacterales bacterium]|nr:redoxin [Bryobacterales bacterium]
MSWKLEFVETDVAPGAKAAAKLTATITEPWHLYSPTTPAGGPIVTKLTVDDNPVVATFEYHRPQPVRKHDASFSMDTETYEKEAVFYVLVSTKSDAPAGPAEITASVRYQVCTDTQCLPPVTRKASATLILKPGAPASSFAPPPGYAVVSATNTSATPSTTPAPASSAAPAAPTSLWQFALVAFGLGLAAVFTPCVFPMIPFTVSVFIRSNSLAQAAAYAGGIVVFFTSLGLIVSALLGPFGVVQLGSNPWVNAVIATVFFAFSLSLLGAFEITLPSSWLTRMDSLSQSKGGVLGALLMGLTFALTSFACVGPFMGGLLAASVQGDKLQPAIGMLGFSSGLASPFFFLALFPGAMQKMPRSGGWLPRVKTVLGFILLALTLKYLSNIDQVLQTGYLTRERFLAAWIILFLLPGLYLLGFLRMEGIKRDETVG